MTFNPSLSTRQAKHLAFALLVITAGVNLQAPLYAAYAKSDGVGGLSNRIGRRPVMLIALLLSALGSGLVMLHHAFVERGLAQLSGVGLLLILGVLNVR